MVLRSRMGRKTYSYRCAHCMREKPPQSGRLLHLGVKCLFLSNQVDSSCSCEILTSGMKVLFSSNHIDARGADEVVIQGVKVLSLSNQIGVSCTAEMRMRVLGLSNQVDASCAGENVIRKAASRRCVHVTSTS
jgi:hypothetical protein